MLLAALSRRYTAALFISWTSLRTADCCIAAIQLKAEKGTHSKRCVTTRREAERSQMPETAKNITCRYCFQNLTSTEGLKSSLQHTGLTSHAALCIPAGKGEATKATAPASASPPLLFGFSHLLFRFSHSGYNYLLWKVLFTSVTNLTDSFVYGNQEQ